MKTAILKAMLATLLLLVCDNYAVAIWIDGVDVVPPQPLETDTITLNIFGRASGSSSQVAYDLFSQNETFLQLDLYVNVGILPAFSEWTYSKEIQPLPPATYILEVRAFDNYYGTLQDTCTLDFTVVPEPGSLLLFAAGGLVAGRIHT